MPATPVEQGEDVDGRVDGVVASQHEKASPASHCSVHGWSESAIGHSEDPEEEERTYGVWYAAHQDRSETMRLGMLLEPAYPAVEYSRGQTMCEGREAWLRFHMHQQSSVEMVKRQVIVLIEEQWREMA